MDPENEELDTTLPPEDDLRADMEAAIEQVESEFTASASSSPEQKTPEQTPEGQTEISAGSETDESRPDADDNVVKLHGDDSERYPTLNEEKVKAAPEGWRPAAREGWDALPEPVRREIHRRELDIATGMQTSKDARTLADNFSSTVTPYKALLAAEGHSDPLQAIEGMLKTVSGLRMGSPQQKADKFAGMVQHYGIDLNILDQALAARINNEPPPESDPVQAAVEARLKPFEEFMANVQGERQTALERQNASATEDVGKFEADAEFISDVRLDMADLLDLSSKRGRQMSLQEAYDTACQMNPEIRGILSARGTTTKATTAAQRLAAKVATASASPTGNRGGGESGPRSDGTLRGDIMASIESLEETG